MIYLTTNNIPPYGPSGFISSLSFLRGLFRGGESQPVSLRERRRSRRKEDEKARGSKPGTSLPDNLLRE